MIAGNFSGIQGGASTFSPVNLWDIKLQAGKRVELAVPEGYSNMLFVRHGKIALGDAVIGTTDMVILERDGTVITLQAQEETSLLLMGGEPLNEPIATSGPFVMNNEQEIRVAMADYQSGRMGYMEA